MVVTFVCWQIWNWMNYTTTRQINLHLSRADWKIQSRDSNYGPQWDSHCTLHTWDCTRAYTKHYTQHTTHSMHTLSTAQWTMHTSNSTPHTEHGTLHTALRTLHTAHFTLHTSHFTLHTSHFKLHTEHYPWSIPDMQALHIWVDTEHTQLDPGSYGL